MGDFAFDEFLSTLVTQGYFTRTGVALDGHVQVRIKHVKISDSPYVVFRGPRNNVTGSSGAKGAVVGNSGSGVMRAGRDSVKLEVSRVNASGEVVKTTDIAADLWDLYGEDYARYGFALYNRHGAEKIYGERSFMTPLMAAAAFKVVEWLSDDAVTAENGSAPNS